ncbi:hypothetical protein [Streptomyces sp. NBC_01198]|uniref:hypothetical protein n=1 Tax=Streptomyces sp. NBC_01198 TaxID=2903769 RepID=UPI002E102614|nr:hypothetical protein OG702_30875 [Streptomyces sp. NBC_01198]
MSTAPDQPAAPPAQVTVTLDSCAKEDARTVLDALRAAFAFDRDTDDAPLEAPSGGPVVWTATFDVSRPLADGSGPARLGEPVTLTAQGGYRAVDRLREGLAESFTVTVIGTASGDQEQEAGFRLENR